MTCRSPKPRVRPRLDSLEARDCPAIIVAREGPTLYLTGDAADDWVAVCDEGLQAVKVQTERGTEIFRGIRRVVANLGEGNDTVEFHQADETSRSNSLVVVVDLAAGDDQFLYPQPPVGQAPPDSGRPARYVLDVHTGAGNDVMAVAPGFVPGLGVEIRADLGDGADEFKFHPDERPMESLNVAVDLGAGDDTIQLLPPQHVVLSPYPLDSDSPAKWYLNFRAGFGNDAMTIQPLVVPGLDLSIVADLGDGDDAFDAAFEARAARAGTIIPGIGLVVDAGEGNDAVEVVIGNPDILDPLRVADAHVGINTGDGNDSAIIIDFKVTVAGRLTQTVDLGAGDDAASLTLEDVTVGRLLKQSVTGGDGADEVGIIIIGGRIGAVAQKAHVGEGDDLVSLSWQGCEILGPAVTRVSLGDGHDEGVTLVEADARFGGTFAVSMDTGGGDDLAAVLIQDSEDFEAFEGPVTLRVGLGEGNDLANVVLRDANDVAGPLTVAVAGGAGEDGIVADVDFTPRVRAGQLDPGNAPVSALIDLRGGEGFDTLDAYTEGEWYGVARFNLRGGAGDDGVGFRAVLGAGSTGAWPVCYMDGGEGHDVLTADVLVPTDQVSAPVVVRMLGGADDDVLSLSLLGGPNTTPEPHLFVLDGGAGFDVARAPAGAIVRNCENRA